MNVDLLDGSSIDQGPQFEYCEGSLLPLDACDHYVI